MFRILRPMLLALLATAAACGGSDEEGADESAACRSFLSALERCMDDWCSGEGSGNLYCSCYENGEAVLGGQGTCGCEGSWRAAYRQTYCGEDMPDDAGALLDCPGTRQLIENELAAACGE